MVALAAIVAVLSLPSCGRMTEREEEVNAAWADVEMLCQRRAALVPNLLCTVRGHAPAERAALDEAEAARAAATAIDLSCEELTQERLAGYERAQERLHAALESLTAVAERCPELKADANFRAVRTEIAATEERIEAALRLFNDAVRSYNAAVGRFPFNLTGAEPKPLFAAVREEAAEEPATEGKEASAQNQTE